MRASSCLAALLLLGCPAPQPFDEAMRAACNAADPAAALAAVRNPRARAALAPALAPGRPKVARILGLRDGMARAGLEACPLLESALHLSPEGVPKVRLLGRRRGAPEPPPRRLGAWIAEITGAPESGGCARRRVRKSAAGELTGSLEVLAGACPDAEASLVRVHGRALGYCFAREARPGRLSVSWRYAHDGRPEGIAVTGGPPKAARCVQTQIALSRVPPGTPCRVRYTLGFAPSQPSAQ